MTNSYDSCPLVAQFEDWVALRAAHRSDRVGVQTFAGPGEIDLSRHRHLTGALGGTTELPGLSRDRQNRCQYANDLKWPARPPQASPHNTPSGGAHAHTQSGAVAARPTLPSPRLLTGPAIIAARVPRELLTKIGKHWGGYMIAIRSFHGVRNPFGAFAQRARTSTGHPNRHGIASAGRCAGEG